MQKIGLILSAFFLLASCSTYEEKNLKNLKTFWGNYLEKDFDSTKTIEVFVVTNRKAKNANSAKDFGCDENSFGVVSQSKLQFGTCKINVPKNHTIGEIPLSKDGRQSSNNYFKVLEAKALQQTDLIEILKKSERTPLVFVHGFNVSYQEAILRAAQIAYDLKYQGPIVLFTWPAGAGDGFFDDKLLNKTYENNLANARASVEFFKNFLLDCQKNNIKINLAVHSMGHQVVLPALKKMGEKNQNKFLINELVLNAPDFEVDEFKAMTKNIKQTSQRVTLYCSYNDKAMLASKTFNNSGSRLGACAAFDDFDTVNVSLVDDTTLGLGHGYYSSRAILSDVFQTLLGIDAQKRLFIVKSEPNSTEKYFLRK